MTDEEYQDIERRLTEAEKRLERFELLQAKREAARAVIREFVYPNSPMTPAQAEAWQQWLSTQSEHEQHDPYPTS